MSPEKSKLKDITEIRDMMERSTRFLSLSGLAGVFAGLVAIVAALTAFYYLGYDVRYFDPQTYFSQELYMKTINEYTGLLILGILTLIIAIGGSVIFSTRKAKKKGLQVWNAAGKRMVINLFIPLVAGGIFLLIMLYHNLVFLIAPITLIFYGLGLINASKYTLKETKYLGLSEVILGLAASLFIGYGMIFWTIGFGLLHIVYGIWMYRKYEL